MSMTIKTGSNDALFGAALGLIIGALLALMFGGGK